VHATPGSSRRGPLLAALAVVLVVGVGAGGVLVLRGRSGDEPVAAATAPSTPALPTAGSIAAPTGPAATTPARTSTGPKPTTPATCGQWGCTVQHRLDAAARLVGTEPGKLGVTVLDRRTGAVWEAGTAAHLMWASSTPKLALATSLLERDRAGEISLDAAARQQIAAMLAVSDDNAADALWDRYGGASLLPRFRDRYGMSGATFVPGFPQRWGFIKVSAQDLRRLMTYVLTRTDPADRAYLTGAMRTTGSIQHWGVWAAGPAQRPGAKDGWSVESDGGVQHWCTSSVGFAGDGERYVVAVMDDLPAGAGIAAGVHAVSDVVATIFGARTPAAITVPDESTGR
jgi:hypothetical protein